jgi:hypothetical protein
MYDLIQEWQGDDTDNRTGLMSYTNRASYRWAINQL